jgi:diacylglycerol kinase (ATP)
MRLKKFSLRERMRSFQFAFEGLSSFFGTQHNAWIHAAATLLAVVLSIVLQISRGEWLFIIFALGLVWMAELFNTAIEILCDKLCPQIDPTIKIVKDIAAAAVLITALLALITACLIFIPKFF